MKLYRYLLVDFQPELSPSWDRQQSEIDDIFVTVGSRESEPRHTDRRIITAHTNLDRLPDLDDQMCILIPNNIRAKCEFYSEHVINIMSVLEGCARHIFSPMGCVALEASSMSEHDFLDSSKGIRIVNNTESSAVWNVKWSPEIGHALSDRMDGVALLSEAFSSGGDASMYREFVRFLELAFSVQFSDKRLLRKLGEFLGQAGYGYDRDEIKEWANLRHASIHADLRKTKWIAMTREIRPVIFRMRQACLDVLFNKEIWHDSSTKRRDVYLPYAFTTSKSGHILAKYESVLNINFRLYDEFCIYPRKINVSIDHSKDNFYSKYFHEPVLPRI